jgi:hypothetical protein
VLREPKLPTLWRDGVVDSLEQANSSKLRRQTRLSFCCAVRRARKPCPFESDISDQRSDGDVRDASERKSPRRRAGVPKWVNGHELLAEWLTRYGRTRPEMGAFKLLKNGFAPSVVRSYRTLLFRHGNTFERRLSSPVRQEIV